jgi:TctA family transporter
MEYTGGWEDLAVLALFSVLGIACKRYQVSRPTLLIGFLLAERIYNLSYQTFMIYSFDSLATRPLFLAIMCAAAMVLFLGLRSKNRLDFA